MSNLTKQALRVENSTNFPNNTTNYITPELLRSFNNDMIDSVVVNDGTASFATTGSNSFNGDQTISGDLNFNNTGVISVNYIESAGSPTLQLNADTIHILNSLDVNDGITATSISASVVGIGNVTAYSASVDSRLNNAQGVQGSTGAQGASGTNGTDGAQGASGATGGQGVQGSQGATAAQGQVGLQGVQGYIGTQGTQGITGAGTQGAQGATGTQGAIGATGNQGEQGIQGAQGVQGTIGEKGDQGIQGIQGRTGASGSQGSTGSGTQGAIGSQGSVGSQGTQGIQGVQGATPSTASFAVLSGGNSFSGDQQLNGNFTMTGSLDVNGTNVINTLNGLSSLTSSYAISSSVAAIDAGQDTKINSLISVTGSYAISSSVAAVDAGQDTKINALTAKTGSYATTGSNTFSGNQTINANLIANKVSVYNFDSLFYGSQLGGTLANGTFFGYGSTDYQFILGAYAGGFDSELKISADNTGITFGDFNGASYPSFLKLLPNTGANPSPIFTRGLISTGSLRVSGSTTITGSTSVLGTLTSTFNQPNNNAQVDNLKVNSFVDKYGYTLTNNTLGWQRYEGTVEGWVQELYTADYAYGSSTRHEANGMTWEIYPSGSAYDSNLVSLQGESNGTTTFKVLADSAQITGSVGVKGNLTIQSGSGDLYVHGHKQFNYGAFQSNTTQSGSAGVSQSIELEITDSASGVICDALSLYKQIRVVNAGVYQIQFSAQFNGNGGADTVYVWFKKNGTNIADSATKLYVGNNTEGVMTVPFVVEAAANDYYELVWQNTTGNGVLQAYNASGNIPTIPSIIVTVTQLR